MDRVFVALRPVFGFIGGVVFTLAFLGATQATAVVDSMVALADNIGRLVVAVIGIIGVGATAWASHTALKNSSPEAIIRRIFAIASGPDARSDSAKIALMDAAGSLPEVKQILTVDADTAQSVPNAKVVAG